MDDIFSFMPSSYILYHTSLKLHIEFLFSKFIDISNTSEFICLQTKYMNRLCSDWLYHHMLHLIMHYRC